MHRNVHIIADLQEALKDIAGMRKEINNDQPESCAELDSFLAGAWTQGQGLLAGTELGNLQVCSYY